MGIEKINIMKIHVLVGLQGLWMGIICAMIVQLIILVWIIVHTDWHHETLMSQERVQKSQGSNVNLP